MPNGQKLIPRLTVFQDFAENAGTRTSLEHIYQMSTFCLQIPKPLKNYFFFSFFFFGIHIPKDNTESLNLSGLTPALKITNLLFNLQL